MSTALRFFNNSTQGHNQIEVGRVWHTARFAIDQPVAGTLNSSVAAVRPAASTVSSL
jgi:hypothetical protein